MNVKARACNAILACPSVAATRVVAPYFASPMIGWPRRESCTRN